MELPAKKTDVRITKGMISEERRKIQITSENMASLTKEILSTEGKYTVVINSTERDKEPVFVAINGHTYNIPRDTEVELPDSVVRVLSDARVTVYIVVPGHTPSAREVNRFSYSKVKKAE